MNKINIPVLSNDTGHYSRFEEACFTLDEVNGMYICARQDALNFRHRMSNPGYCSSWHIAGDPTLIIIRSGTLRIGLRDGSYKDFSAGDQFIARDKLPDGSVFDDKVHGHTAEVIGNEQLFAVHIKLSSLDT